MKKKFTIKFKNVGRNKLSWDEDVETVDARTLTRAVHKKGAIASREPEFVLSAFPEKPNAILAGWHKVGEFEIVLNGRLQVVAP